MTKRSLQHFGGAALLASALAVLSPSCTDNTGPDGAVAHAVTGTVTRHKTGGGVANLVVVLTGPDGIAATTHTDAAGRFRFTGVSPGDYTVRLAGLDLAGIDTRFDALEPPSHDVTVGGSSDLVFTVVALIPPRITGDVFCAGTPVAGARVRVVGGAADVTSLTNAQGKYGALDLLPGHYAVFPVEAPCAVTPLYHALELRPGQSGRADFEG